MVILTRGVKLPQSSRSVQSARLVKSSKFIKSYDYVILICGVFIGVLLITICIVSKKRKAEYYKKHEGLLIDIKNKISKMIPYFDKHERIRLTRLKLQPDIKSYTINKHDMHLCLEQSDGNYYDENILIYVTLHELAHIFCNEIGHTDAYFNIFERLLRIADKVGIYDPTMALPKEYCGIKI